MFGNVTTLAIRCVSCGRGEFAISTLGIENELIPIATFLCPHCGDYTAVSKRDGGGVLVSRDEHLAKKRSS